MRMYACLIYFSGSLFIETYLTRFQNASLNLLSTRRTAIYFISSPSAPEQCPSTNANLKPRVPRRLRLSIFFRLVLPQLICTISDGFPPPHEEIGKNAKNNIFHCFERESQKNSSIWITFQVPMWKINTKIILIYICAFT